MGLRMFILYLDNFSEGRRLGGGEGARWAQFFFGLKVEFRGGDGPPNFYSILRQFFRGASTGGGAHGGPIFFWS